MRRLWLVLVCLVVPLSGCNLAPRYERPAPAVPTQWPSGSSYRPENAQTAGMPWRSLIKDEKLRQVIVRALANNQNLRASLANVASARALYHVDRSYELPTVSADVDGSQIHTLHNSSSDTKSYSAGIGMSSFEMDLFGRLKNQAKAAFETYLSTASGLRATRMSLVAETATAYATLASDRDLLRIATATVSSSQRSVALTQSLFNAGLESATDVQSAITLLEQANSDVEDDTTLVAQDRNALELLVGGPVEDALLPVSLAELDGSMANVPAGLSSKILLQRPDVLEAEHSLKSADASIGEARAAFFPVITLTSAVGVASSSLSSLFSRGAVNWSLAPSVSVPLLGGTAQGNLDYARAQRDYYLAEYQQTVQSAFKDVANGLARRSTITRQRAAQSRWVAASAKAYDLSNAQYRAGTGEYLDVLTAQRTFYAAQQTQVSTVLTDISNRIALYEALGADDSL